MKFTVTFKTPDALDQVKDELAEYEDDEECEFSEKDEHEPDDEEIKELEEKIAEAAEFFDEWTRYAECITIEFDTEKNTATVVKPSKR